MSPLVRRIAIISAWVAFITAAPILIIYSLGHKITPNSPIPVAVGNFILRTNPSNASVFVNEKEYSKSPTEVRSLLPGNYKINISKEGYRDWQKNLPIEGTMVTDVMHVKLIPNEIEEDITRGNVIDYSISPKEEWLVVTEGTSKGKQLRILQLSKFTQEGILSKLQISQKDNLTFSWSPNETHLILTLKRKDNKKDYLINIQTGEYQLLNLGEIIGWVPNDENKLVVKEKNKITLAPVISSISSNPVVISSSVSSFAYGDGGYIIAEKDDQKKTVLNEFYSNGDKKSSIPLPQDVSEISFLTVSPFGDIALLSGPKQKMYIWRSDSQKWQQISEHADSLKWSPSGKELLWSETEFDIWVLNLREDRSPIEKMSSVLVGRFSNPIHDPSWYSDSQHILFFQNDTFKIIEVDPRDGHLVENLVSTNMGNSISRCLGNGNIIFMNAKRKDNPVLLRIFLLTANDRGLKIVY